MPKVIGDMTLYTVLELSKLLDVTEVTLRRYIKEGKLPAKKIGGAYHISEEALKDFVNKGEPSNDNSTNTEDAS
jgi:excisionase family DNA binding protein